MQLAKKKSICISLAIRRGGERKEKGRRKERRAGEDGHNI